MWGKIRVFQKRIWGHVLDGGVHLVAVTHARSYPHNSNQKIHRQPEAYVEVNKVFCLPPIYLWVILNNSVGSLKYSFIRTVTKSRDNGAGYKKYK